MVREADEALSNLVAKLKKRVILPPYKERHPGPHDAPDPRPEDPSLLRGHVQEARREPGSLRPRQDPLRGHRALGHHVLPRTAGVRHAYLRYERWGSATQIRMPDPIRALYVLNANTHA